MKKVNNRRNGNPLSVEQYAKAAAEYYRITGLYNSATIAAKGSGLPLIVPFEERTRTEQRSYLKMKTKITDIVIHVGADGFSDIEVIEA